MVEYDDDGFKVKLTNKAANVAKQIEDNLGGLTLET